MRLLCISDLHGQLPDLTRFAGKADALLIAGDICGPSDVLQQARFLDLAFRPWLAKLATVGIPSFVVAGNHDWIFQNAPHLVPQGMPWTYLQDQGVVFNNSLIWGSPWQKPFMNWAFNMPEERLADRWARIPHDADILLMHGPPHGIGDLSGYGWKHTGSESLTKRIEEIKPKLVVYGHIHRAYGIYNIGETVCINASHLDEDYNGVNPPILINI